MSRRILIVDDDEMVLLALDELLSPEGYEIHTVPSGAEALERLKKKGYDLLMLDIIMPEMNGFELCRKIREMDHCKETPILFLTAKSRDEDRAQGLGAGADLFLTKPILPDKLLKIVSENIR